MEEASKISSQLPRQDVNWKFNSQKESLPTRSSKPTHQFPILSAVRLPTSPAYKLYWNCHKKQQTTLAVKLLNSKYDKKKKELVNCTAAAKKKTMQMLERLPKTSGSGDTCSLAGARAKSDAQWTAEKNPASDSRKESFRSRMEHIKILEELELLVKKEERLQSICNSSGAKTYMKPALMTSVQTMTQKVNTQRVSKLEKSALTVDTAESEDSSDEEDKVFSSSAPISEINHHKENTMTKRSATAQVYKEEYLDSSSESEMNLQAKNAVKLKRIKRTAQPLASMEQSLQMKGKIHSKP
uniref:Uncharacterized protein n=1 Tax=Ditylenchus dipsaci TaxID=166011 RepID=A0A915ECA7_9BILA